MIDGNIVLAGKTHAMNWLGRKKAYLKAWLESPAEHVSLSLFWREGGLTVERGRPLETAIEYKFLEKTGWFRPKTDLLISDNPGREVSDELTETSRPYLEIRPIKIRGWLVGVNKYSGGGPPAGDTWDIDLAIASHPDVTVTFHKPNVRRRYCTRVSRIDSGRDQYYFKQPHIWDPSKIINLEALRVRLARRDRFGPVYVELEGMECAVMSSEKEMENSYKRRKPIGSFLQQVVMRKRLQFCAEFIGLNNEDLPFYGLPSRSQNACPLIKLNSFNILT